MLKVRRQITLESPTEWHRMDTALASDLHLLRWLVASIVPPEQLANRTLRICKETKE